MDGGGGGSPSKPANSGPKADGLPPTSPAKRKTISRASISKPPEELKAEPPPAKDPLSLTSSSSKGASGIDLGKQPSALTLQKQDTQTSQHDNNLRDKYTVEREDDRGQLQQVSGGFGDSNNIDEETVKAIMKQQQMV